MKYTCECCEYNTNRKSNYQTHLLSKKHKSRNSIDESSELNNMYICNNCSSKYIHKSSLYRHQKQCKQSMNILEKQNKKLEKQIKELEKKTKELEKKTIIINNTINNNIIENQTININNYNNTDNSHIKDSDFANILLNDVFTSLTKLLEIRHINPDKPENMNLLITNMKDKYMKIYQDNNWKIVDRKQQIDIIFDELWTLFIVWKQTNKHLFTKIGELKYNTMEKHLENQDSRVKKEMAYDLYNNRKIILENKDKHVYSSS